VNVLKYKSDNLLTAFKYNVEMGEAHSRWEIKSICQVGRHEGRPLGRRGHSWQSNVIVTDMQLGCELDVYQLKGEFQ
jgi:hypothetical protein